MHIYETEGILRTNSALGEGFCNAETENMVDWPETRSGSGPVVMACPGSEGRTVTRECIDGIWTEADYSICLGQS